MRLLFIDFTLPYLLRDNRAPVGGWAVQLRIWLEALSASGHRCGVLTWKGANAYVGKQQFCELLDTYDPKAGVKIAKYLYVRIPSLLATARAWRPDAIVQSTRCIETGIMAFIATRIRAPFVYRVASDADVDERFRVDLPSYACAAFAYGLRQADLVLCQNAYQERALRRSLRSARFHVQPNAFWPTAPLREPLPRNRRDYIAWLGVFRRPKNLPLLLEVAKATPGANFRVAGIPTADEDPETGRAREELATLANVSFAGYLTREEIPEFLANATALLCTSHYEGFSNTFLEALHAGTPVITRKSVDPDFIIANGGLGLVAERDGQLTDCIRAIQEMEPGEYDALARRCREYVETRHSPEPIMKSFVDAISPLVGTTR